MTEISAVPAYNPYYHVAPVQKDLIEAGAMAKVGERIFLHKSRFWPEYQRIVASQMGGAK